MATLEQIVKQHEANCNNVLLHGNYAVRALRKIHPYKIMDFSELSYFETLRQIHYMDGLVIFDRLDGIASNYDIRYDLTTAILDGRINLVASANSFEMVKSWEDGEFLKMFHLVREVTYEERH